MILCRHWAVGIFLWLGCAVAVPVAAQQVFRVMEYNVENLFDCTHDSLKNDREFLPDGLRRWTYRRYTEKLGRIAQVIWSVADGGEVPAIVGLCEVENGRCLEDLVSRSPLQAAGYRYVLTDSPDLRGIDVALLYHPQQFRCLSVQSVRIPLTGKGCRPTRDLLHVCGRMMATGDTLDVLVCHLPSRLGGVRKTRPFRLQAARRLRQVADSVAACRMQPRLLLMGDFNDTPGSRTLAEVLDASAAANGAGTLIDLMEGQLPGTYCYRGHWEIIDHLIVNGTLQGDAPGWRVVPSSVRIVDAPFLLEEDDTYGGVRPFRTYRGFRYAGGYSDHLPIVAEFQTYE